jgi:hypothetical protein
MKYEILDENNNVINTIVADEHFMSANYVNYREYTFSETQINLEEEARDWRNQELTGTDWIVPTIDHPHHALYLEYRQALRDWPSTSEFPNIRPTKP